MLVLEWTYDWIITDLGTICWINLKNIQSLPDYHEDGHTIQMGGNG